MSIQNLIEIILILQNKIFQYQILFNLILTFKKNYDSIGNNKSKVWFDYSIQLLGEIS